MALKQIKRAAISLLAFFMILSSGGCTESEQCSTETTVLPVLMYHGLTENNSRQNRYMISPALFEQDLKYLRSKGYTTIFASELISYIRNGSSLPAKPVILTFDDGYLNNYTYAYPLLKKYKMKALISPIGISADEAENEKYRSPEWSQCKWSELREMVRSGCVELGNHTYDLHKLTAGKKGATRRSGESDIEYKQRLSEDILSAQNRIEKETGKKPESFVYPFGAKSEGSDNVIRSLGFSAIFDCENKINTISSQEDLYRLHRFLRPLDISSEVFLSEILDCH